MVEPPITDAERYPGLSDAGAAMLKRLIEHPHAPIFRNTSGHKLSAADVNAVRDHERDVLNSPAFWRPNQPPDWLPPFVARCLGDVPHYRDYGIATRALRDLPTMSRADLSADITRFVPDSLSLDGVINFSTSGTTGHPLLLPSHPIVAAGYLAFIKKALALKGISLTHGAGQVGVVLVGYQRKCFTYVSVTPTMDESGLAKINLHPDDWRDPADRARYLDDLDSEVYTGDPISFGELLKLPLRTRPKALVSTSMMLLPGMRKQLEDHFGCVVLDMYSMNETGPIAFALDAEAGHVCVQPRLFIEILDAQGNPAPPGTTGEVTLTGGFNPYLPLLRYRTGDRAALRFDGDQIVLAGLAGRPPTIYRAGNGAAINNVDVTHAIKPFALPQWQFHQFADGAVRLRVRGYADARALQQALSALFGTSIPITIEIDAPLDDKLIQYTVD